MSFSKPLEVLQRMYVKMYFGERKLIFRTVIVCADIGSLDNNQLGDQTGMALAEVLKTNKTLSYIP